MLQPSARFVCALATASLLTLTGATACERSKEQGQAREDSQDGPVRRLTIAEPAKGWDAHWDLDGFVAMVPPVRLPTSTAGQDDVVVWLRVPDGATIETVEGDDGELRLRFPPGTVADRVESRGPANARRVIDVRGTRIDEDGEEWMHTYRSDARGGLFGYEWPRSSAQAHAEATRRLLAELETQPRAQKLDAKARAAYLRRIETKNDCVGCHSHSREINAVEGEFGVVNRGTDASGFFTPQTVLAENTVLESYGAIDPNLRHPWVELSCPQGEAPQRVRHGKRLRAECDLDAVPIARFSLAKALEADDRHAREVCAARRYLYDRLDERGKLAFEPAAKICGIDL
ncbi:hypothetical protein PPSIR1_37764 [Plesiocystis pacifica SIR-1]|uniref:Cytochrome c domain-containing protein n=1 Tax=Plesiocystis pacifica SIR-1 TaxID=391625 RepID=A6GHL8_9BACT|nr:hypothetical protein [Plesiocystis pacifica]EDM74642.1 hypothetical protein PPSIR1_37764 [Plesiocystis pacifica SIR-1]